MPPNFFILLFAQESEGTLRKGYKTANHPLYMQKEEWKKGRSLGLEGALGRIGNLTNYVKQILKRKSKVKVLEVGCGYGRALLELKKIFGDRIEIAGTNLEKEYNLALTKKYAISQGLFFGDKNLPKIYALDAGKKLPFKNKSFDFIFCQATMQYISDKILFIQETNRVLTKEGMAVLELQEFRDDHPREYRDMIEVWDNGKKVNILSHLKKFKNIQIKKSTGRCWHYLIMKKNSNFNLNLRFVYFINLGEISPSPIFWGGKSVYVLNG